MDMVIRAVRHVMPDALFDPPPSDRRVEQAGRTAVRKARRTVEDWEAALRWEREFWEARRTSQEHRGTDD